MNCNSGRLPSHVAVKKKDPPSPGHPSAWSITRTTGPSPASSSLTGKIWPSLHLPSRRTGKHPCSSGFTPLLCISGFTPLHFSRPVCVAAGLPRCYVFPGSPRCSVFPRLPHAFPRFAKAGLLLLLPRKRLPLQIHCNVSNQEKVITVTNFCQHRDKCIPKPPCSCWKPGDRRNVF